MQEERPAKLLTKDILEDDALLDTACLRLLLVSGSVWSNIGADEVTSDVVHSGAVIVDVTFVFFTCVSSSFDSFRGANIGFGSVGFRVTLPNWIRSEGGNAEIGFDFGFFPTKSERSPGSCYSHVESLSSAQCFLLMCRLRSDFFADA